jgi:cation:H+ antiporter
MLEYILFVIGFILIVKGADYLVDGASTIATHLGIPQLIIGLTVVAFGTSMPELVVAVISSLEGSAEITLGNVIGSNISNILLILGISAVIHKIKIKNSTIWKEIPFSLLAALLLLAFVNDSTGERILSFYDGVVMLSVFAIFIYYTFSEAFACKTKICKKEVMKIEKSDFYKSIGLILAGLVGLFFGGKFVVDGAVFIATQFGFSEFLISSTIIAIGTSLPELVVTVVASMKKKVDMAVGNIIGSNIFNILLVLGTASLISPITVQPFINTDITFLIYMTCLLFGLVFINKKKELGKFSGLFFILLYIAYIIFLVGRG